MLKIIGILIAVILILTFILLIIGNNVLESRDERFYEDEE